MHKILTLLCLAFVLTTSAQQYTGSFNVGQQNMTLNVTVDATTDEVDIELTGPDSKWFAFGFGNLNMGGTYIIVNNGNGTVEERKIQRYNSGVQLSNSLSDIVISSSSGVKTFRAKRDRIGATSDHFTFPANGGSLQIIWADARDGDANINSLKHRSKGWTTITLQEVNPCPPTAPKTVFQDIEICNNQSIVIFGESRNASGTYLDTVTTDQGCDSILEQTLIVHPTKNTTLPEISICEGDSVEIFGEFRSVAGTYTDVQTTSEGCDSIIEQTLITIPPSNTTLPDISICEGDSVEIFGNFETEAGIYSAQLTSAEGCDSNVIVTLNVDDIVTNTLPTIRICEGESIEVFGETVDEPGIYNDTVVVQNGCDSIFSVEVQFELSLVVSQDAIFCQGDTAFHNGEPVTNVSVFLDTLRSVNGCDSLIIETFYGFVLGDFTVEANNNQAAVREQNAEFYQWIDCETETPIQGANSREYTVNSGTQTVRAIVEKDGCRTETECVTITSTGITQNDFGAALNVYPNPTNNTLNVKLGASHELVRAVLVNTLGARVLMLENHQVNELNMDLSHLSSGNYILNIVSAEKSATIKVLKR